MAWIDCYLIQGCEVCPDAEDTHVKQLEDVQIRFIRRMLGVHRHSMIVPVYTETGIMPLRVCRFLLTLRYLKYILKLESTHFLQAVLLSACELAAAGKRSWWSDLIKAKSKLPFDTPDLVASLLSDEYITSYLEVVESQMNAWLTMTVNGCNKLYLCRTSLWFRFFKSIRS